MGFKRKPNAYEREALYLGAKEAGVNTGFSDEAAIAWLKGVKWLHPYSVEGIAAKVVERLAVLRK